MITIIRHCEYIQGNPAVIRMDDEMMDCMEQSRIRLGMFELFYGDISCRAQMVRGDHVPDRAAAIFSYGRLDEDSNSLSVDKDGKIKFELVMEQHTAWVWYDIIES